MTAMRVPFPFVYMNLFLRLALFVVIYAVLPALSHAQPDFSASLRRLSDEDKLLLLDYLRVLGTNVDRLATTGYEQLDADRRAKAAAYAGMLAQDWADLPRTTVRWNRDTLDFVAIEEGTILLDSFTVTNTGRNPYAIRDVRANCDCSVLHYPRYPIMPGESATLRIAFDSSGKIGRTTPGIIVYDNSSPNTRTILYLQGDVVPRRPGKPRRY